MTVRSGALLLLLAVTALVDVRPALALPTMIRLGYTDCAACHLSPQGGGLLNPYGRGIDEAQSLRADEYTPATDGLAMALSWRGRITQDVRSVVQEQGSWSAGRNIPASFRARLMYRNVTAFNERVRVSATATAESLAAPRPARAYDPATSPSSLFVNTALVHYRASKAVEFAAGRDQLPSGVNLPDLALLVRSRNRLGYYDTPTQVKMFVNTSRVHVTPFAYTGGGNEQAGEHESGAGTLAEAAVPGLHAAIVGVTAQKGTSTHGNRQLLGGYARLGFGSWGILAEHDVTDRTRDAPLATTFRQNASFAQVFWAAREWFVLSAIGERLRVEGPFAERLDGGRIEVAARLSSQVSVGLSSKLQRDAISGRLDRGLAVTAAFKTAQ